jgi:hypothetical protein
MNPVTLALLSTIPGLIQGGLGVFQGIQGNRAGKVERPTYEIPEGIKQMVDMAGREASQTELPGQALMEQNISSSTSRGVNEMSKVSDGSALLGGVVDLILGEQQQMGALGVAGGEQRQNNLKQLYSALGMQADAENMAFQYNELQPYLQAQQQAQALKSASIQNIAGGLTSGLGTAMNMTMQNEYLDVLKGIYGIDSTEKPEGIAGKTLFNNNGMEDLWLKAFRKDYSLKTSGLETRLFS